MIRSFVAVLISTGLVVSAAAQDDVKSSFQPGGKAPGFEAMVATGEFAGQKLDYMEKIKDKPVLFIAVNRVTRPGHRMLSILDKYGEHRKDKDEGGLQTVILRLTDDVEKAVEYSKLLAERYGFKGVGLVSSDGQNGPLSYGFNPDVELTVLVMDKTHTVTASFAYRDPQENDFRKIRAEIDKLLGAPKKEFKVEGGR